MTRLVLARVIGSIRQSLAIVITLLAIAGTGYLGSHKLSNPDHYEYGGCPSQIGVYHGGPLFGRSCMPPTRFAWQIPLAVLLAAAGSGAALAVAGDRPLRHAHA